MSPRRKLLEQKAVALKVPGYKVLTDSELEIQIKDRGGTVPPNKDSPKVIEGKAVEVIPPAKSVQGLAGGLVINVPIPAINIESRPRPEWWEIAARVKNDVLILTVGLTIGHLLTRGFM